VGQANVTKEAGKGHEKGTKRAFTTGVKGEKRISTNKGAKKIKSILRTQQEEERTVKKKWESSVDWIAKAAGIKRANGGAQAHSRILYQQKKEEEKREEGGGASKQRQRLSWPK